jgi:RND superfamily putative drug exporter
VFEKWTGWAVRFRVAIIGFWIAVAVAGFLANGRISQYLSTSLAVPGTESAQAEAILSQHFGEKIEGSFTVVYKFGSATPAQLKEFENKLVKVAKSIPTGTLTQVKVLGGVFYANIGTSLNLIQASLETDRLRIALKEFGLQGALVTGPPAIEADIAPILSSDLHRGALIAIVLAFLLLLIIIGFSGALVIPFLVAGATISGTISIVYLIAQHWLMVLYVPNIIELIGLGLAIDYSLLIVHRYRTEMSVPKAGEIEVLVRTMNTAGRTIFFSGLTVAIGLTTLFLVPVPFVRSLAAAGVLVPIISLLAAITLQPALLSLLGRKGVTPFGIHGLMANNGVFIGIWTRVSQAVIGKPWRYLFASLVTIATLALSLLWLQLTPSSVSAIPNQIESNKALTFISEGISPGIITPIEIVMDFGLPGRSVAAVEFAATRSFASAVLADQEVFTVAIGKKSPYVDSTGRYQRVFVIAHHEFGSEESKKLVNRLREIYLPKAAFSKGVKIYVGGAPAQGVDFLAGIYRSFPLLIFLALLLTYILLIRTFRSLLLPLIAVLLNLASLASTFGVLVLIFHFGIGSKLLGTYHIQQLEGWSLIFLVAILFGLSMDYEVFMVSRMRESWDRGSTTEEAITEGLSQIGGVVTAAAIILVGAVSGLMFGHIVGLQQIGFGLAVGVIIDSTIVRGILLPSVMILLGRWNWWLPESAARLLQIKASPLESPGAKR